MVKSLSTVKRNQIGAYEKDGKRVYARMLICPPFCFVVTLLLSASLLLHNFEIARQVSCSSVFMKRFFLKNMARSFRQGEKINK
jgi:hypothetical protein